MGDGSNAILIDGDGDDIVDLKNTGQIAGGKWSLHSSDSTAYADYNVYHYSDGASVFARLVVDEDVALNLDLM